MKELGFNSIKISANGKVVLNVGTTFEVKGDMQVTDGVLFLFSEVSGVSLTIPKAHLNRIEILSEYSSVECNEIEADEIQIQAGNKIKLTNTKAKQTYLGSEYSSIIINNCELEIAKIIASDKVKASVIDFCEIAISSEHSNVKFEFLKNETVCAECESSSGEVYIKGLFCGDKKCKRKLYISAGDKIDLVSRGE